MPETTCLYCDRSSSEVPLVEIQYKGSTHYICTEHFPILIHKPHLLAEKFPSGVTFEGSDHDD